MGKKPNRAVQYKIANEKFLEAKVQEEGVKVLESGIIMRQLEVGTGDKYPTLNSIVFVNYTGKLIDGTVFDTTEGEPLPACFRVRELIVGWQAALTRMHAGDKYEVTIPCQIRIWVNENGRHTSAQYTDIHTGIAEDTVTQVCRVR